MGKENKTQNMKCDMDFMRKELSNYRNVIEKQKERLADLESLVVWSSRRLQPLNKAYVLRELERNKND